MTQNSRVGAAALRYVNPDVPLPAPPEYPGEYADALVPATLDLADRATLAVNALTECLDPEYDYELYWIADLLAEKPTMYHTVDDHVQDKFFLALPQCRTASGSTQNIDVERHLMWTYLRKQGADGMIYIPIQGRSWALPSVPSPWAGIDELPTHPDAWASVVMAGRVLGAFSVYATMDPTGPWENAARRLAEAIKRFCVVDGDIAYLARNWSQPDMPIEAPEERPIGFRAAIAGWAAQGLAEYHRLLGDDEAVDLAGKLMLYVFRDSGYFGPNGEFTEEFPESGTIHFHAHTCQIMAALQVAKLTDHTELLGLAMRAYEYGVCEGEPLVGFFPELLSVGGDSSKAFSSEICEVADMIMSALQLSHLGIDKWDDIDRWVRNQFAECQLTSTNWLEDGHMTKVDRSGDSMSGAGSDVPQGSTTERVGERAVGSFSGWPSANDFVQGSGWSIMHCCTGNGTRAIYHVWESILTATDGRLRVNLLLNRSSQWADVDSHIPYTGRVDVRMKLSTSLEIRLPEWVASANTSCQVNGQLRTLEFDGRYAVVGPVTPGDAVTLAFPISERTEVVEIQGQTYTLILRGNDVASIDPPGENCPLYQRGHYRGGETLWKQTTRFTPDREIGWF
jgi:hypothetical protein